MIRATSRVEWTNTRTYSRKSPVGELLLLGTGVTPSGERVPVAVHLAIEKRRDKFDARVHAHPTVRDKLVTAEFEPLTVAVSNGKVSETVLTPESARRAAIDPGLAARLAGILIELRDNLEGVTQDPSRAGFRLADISVGLGEGKLSKMVLRAELISTDASNRPVLERRSLAEMLRVGSWELRLTSLSRLLPKEELQRDLYLMGLDRLPSLAPVMRSGLAKDQSLSFRMRDGTGSVVLAGQSAEIPNVADVSRDYLEFHFLGSSLARQVTHPVSGARR